MRRAAHLQAQMCACESVRKAPEKKGFARVRVRNSEEFRSRVRTEKGTGMGPPWLQLIQGAGDVVAFRREPCALRSAAGSEVVIEERVGDKTTMRFGHRHLMYREALPSAPGVWHLDG